MVTWCLLVMASTCMILVRFFFDLPFPFSLLNREPHCSNQLQGEHLEHDFPCLYSASRFTIPSFIIKEEISEPRFIKYWEKYKFLLYCLYCFGTQFGIYLFLIFCCCDVAKLGLIFYCDSQVLYCPCPCKMSYNQFRNYLSPQGQTA